MHQSGVQNGMTSLALHLAVMGLHIYSWSKWQWPLAHVWSKCQSHSSRFIAKSCNHSCILSWKSLPATQVRSFQACIKYLKPPTDPWNQLCKKGFVITQICWVSACHASNNTHHAKHNTPLSVESMGFLTHSELGRAGSTLLNQILINYTENQTAQKISKYWGLVWVFFNPF